MTYNRVVRESECLMFRDHSTATFMVRETAEERVVERAATFLEAIICGRRMRRLTATAAPIKRQRRRKDKISISESDPSLRVQCSRLPHARIIGIEFKGLSRKETLSMAEKVAWSNICLHP